MGPHDVSARDFRYLWRRWQTEVEAKPSQCVGSQHLLSAGLIIVLKIESGRTMFFFLAFQYCRYGINGTR